MGRIKIVQGACESCRFDSSCNKFREVKDGSYDFKCVLEEGQMYEAENEFNFKSHRYNTVVNHKEEVAKQIVKDAMENATKDKLTGHYDVGGLDPYTVYHKTNMKEHEIGGVIFHILKTAMRFGKKNEKERELKSIIASAKRGLELLKEGESNE